MRSRTAGMWWGVAVEAPDPAALARFYHELLEWPIVEEQPGTSVIGTPGGSFLVFQQADGYQRPVWPPKQGDQRPMMHLDVQVGDLADAVAEAVALGAELAEHQPQENVRVLLDPASHPFCLCRTTADRRTGSREEATTMSRSTAGEVHEFVVVPELAEVAERLGVPLHAGDRVRIEVIESARVAAPRRRRLGWLGSVSTGEHTLSERAKDDVRDGMGRRTGC